MKPLPLLLLSLLIALPVQAHSGGENCATWFDHENYEEAFPLCQADAAQSDVQAQYLARQMYRKNVNGNLI